MIGGKNMGAVPMNRPPDLLCDLRDVASLRAFRAVNDLELDRLSFFQRPKTVALDRREVDEYIAPTVAFNKSVTFGVVKPLNRAFQTFHVRPLTDTHL